MSSGGLLKQLTVPKRIYCGPISGSNGLEQLHRGPLMAELTLVTFH